MRCFMICAIGCIQLIDDVMANRELFNSGPTAIGYQLCEIFLRFDSDR